jgi:UDP-N-acetylglucosamine 2-epimerase (non-hydrolysing)
MKVMTIVGTRPEIIKLSCLIPELDRAFRHVLVHTGQNYDYELNQIFFDGLGLRKPDHLLECAAENAARTIANVIARSDDVMAVERPDAVLLLGDTNSCLAAIAAKRRKIPVFHMEAGNRSFDERVPEELNRRIVDHVSDVNLVYTEHARRHLLAEGLRPETTIKTGSPMREVLEHYRAAIDASDALTRHGVDAAGYFLVSAHREENLDSEGNLRDLLDSLRTVSGHFHLPIIVSTHPRTRSRLAALGVESDQKIRFVKPLGFFDYVRLQLSAFCVLSDSGTLTEEASILGFPAVMVRQAHERPEGIDAGAVVMAGLKSDAVVDAINLVRRHADDGCCFAAPVDYDARDVSAKVVRIILGYTDYVNRRIWLK